MKRLLIAITVLVWGHGAAWTAYGWEPTPGAMFNVPAPWGTTAERYRIVTAVETAINDVPASTPGQPRPVIYLTSYLLDRVESVDALIAACQRGVSVRILLDGSIDNALAVRLVRTLNADNVLDNNGDNQPDLPAEAGPCDTALPGSDPGPMTTSEVISSVDDPGPKVTWGSDQSYVKICHQGCRHGQGFMHSKFYGFSQTGSAQNVVMIGSGNLNQGAANKGWNDLYTITESPGTFAEYRRIHRAMTDEVSAPSLGEAFTEWPFIHRIYPLPGASAQTDPVLQDLGQIACSGPSGPTTVHVSMFYWAHSRGLAIVDRLIALGNQGCIVKIIVGAPSREVFPKLKTAAKTAKIKLWDSRWDLNKSEPGYESRTHQKLFLVSGTFGGQPNQTLVSLGSANWTTPGLLYADENTLNIRTASAHAAFLANWERVRGKSRQVR